MHHFEEKNAHYQYGRNLLGLAIFLFVTSTLIIKYGAAFFSKEKYIKVFSASPVLIVVLFLIGQGSFFVRSDLYFFGHLHVHLHWRD